MPYSVLDAPDSTRLGHELALRARGFVPVSRSDALFPGFERQVPRCRTWQVIGSGSHSRLVWSHPGRSGLDPRAIAPLAIVRLADAAGPDPLDEPLDLASASRWLLDGGITSWLLRPRHRLLLGKDGDTCLMERTDAGTTCLVHFGNDPVLQAAAIALGDGTRRTCRMKSRGRAGCYRWRGAAVDSGSDLLWSALAVTSALADWYRGGVTGTTAWELARNGVRVARFRDWENAGFTVEEAALWSGRGRALEAAALRAEGVQPVEAVRPLPRPTDKDRGLSGYDRWMYTRRRWTFEPCTYCGATAPTGKRCRTCEREDRTTPLHRADWSAYQHLEGLSDAYRPGDPGDPVSCGAENCRTPWAASVADEGVRL